MYARYTISIPLHYLSTIIYNSVFSIKYIFKSKTLSVLIKKKLKRNFFISCYLFQSRVIDTPDTEPMKQVISILPMIYSTCNKSLINYALLVVTIDTIVVSYSMLLCMITSKFPGLNTVCIHTYNYYFKVLAYVSIYSIITYLYMLYIVPLYASIIIPRCTVLSTHSTVIIPTNYSIVALQFHKIL